MNQPLPMPDPIATMRLGDPVPDLSDWVSDEFLVVSVGARATYTETAVMNTADAVAYLTVMPRVHQFGVSVDPNEVEWQVFAMSTLYDQDPGA